MGDIKTQKNVVARFATTIYCVRVKFYVILYKVSILFLYNITLFHLSCSTTFYTYFATAFSGFIRGVAGFFLTMNTILRTMETIIIIIATTWDMAIPVLPICN